MAWCPRGSCAAAAQHACGDENATEKDLKRPVGVVSTETLWPKLSAGDGSRSSTNTEFVVGFCFCFVFFTFRANESEIRGSFI